MGKIVVSQFMSLDGVIEDPETWHFPYISDDMGEFLGKSVGEMEASLAGRKTYEDFASYWPHQSNDDPMAHKFNSIHKYVVSNTLKEGSWNPTTVISGNLDDIVASLHAVKAKHTGVIGMTGSATLVQSLLPTDVIDEYQLYLHPIVVGSGQRLFKDGLAQTGLKLASSQTFQSGVILLIYHRAES
jgi:dihydrofolate reductase